MGNLFSQSTGFFFAAALSFGPIGDALSQTRGALETALYQLRPRPDLVPTGVYALETDFGFNVLDSIHYDPTHARLLLIGHHDSRFAGPRIPYLQHLAALLEIDKPEFTLEVTPESARRVESFLKTGVSDQDFQKINSALDGLFDRSDQLSPAGHYLLPGLAIYPIAGNRAPGFLGIEVERSSGAAVRIIRVTANSPAAQAGLRPGDEIRRVNGKSALSPDEFRRLVRFAGAGNTISLAYARDGQSGESAVELTKDPDGDPWKYVTRYDVEAGLYRAAREQERASAMYSLGVLHAERSRAAVDELANALGLTARINQLISDLASGRKEAAAVDAEIDRAICRRLDELFGFAGGPVLATYETYFSRTHDSNAALNTALRQFESRFKPTNQRLVERALDQPTGVPLGPELLESLIGVSYEMRPRFLGVPANSLLARLVFEADYLAKRLSNRVDFREKISGYQTEFEFEQSHPSSALPLGRSHLWISPDAIDAAQSPSGKTLEFRDAKMRFNIRVYGPDGRDLPKITGGYEDLLTSLYDDFAAEYPTLHELRETAKLAAAARWMHRKDPSVRLPVEGRTKWGGPDSVPGLLYIHLSRGSTPGKLKFTYTAFGGVSLVPLTRFDWSKLAPPTDSRVQDPAQVSSVQLGRTATGSVNNRQIQIGSGRSTKSSPKYVDLYRAVDPTELAHLKATGNYGFSPSRSGKYFALTLAGVINFANHPWNAGRNLTVTHTKVPKRVADMGDYLNDPGGAGPSVHFSDTVLPTVYAAMTPVRILPNPGRP
jgi:hypothetical protein